MRFLIEILIKYRVFIIFILLSFFCLSLILKINPNNEVKAFNTIRNLMYTASSLENNMKQYFGLKQINLELENENCALIEVNELLKSRNNELELYEKYYNVIVKSELNRFNYIPARVVKKNWNLPNNTIILNKGKKHGVEKNMGVFNNNGVVGITSSLTNHFCEVTTLINHKAKLLTSIKTKDGILEEGVLRWGGESHQKAILEGVGNEINISIGDSIFTHTDSKSFYNGIFIGTILDFKKKISSNSFKIDILLGVDFKNISSALIIKDNLKSELNNFYERK